MAAVVDEPGVLALLGGHASAEGGEQRRQPGAPAAGVDDRVGTQLVAIFGDHAADVRWAAGASVASEQATHGDAAAHLDSGLSVDEAGKGRLDHRAPAGDRVEALVAGAPAASERVRQIGESVDPGGTVCLERRRDVRQLGVEQLAEPGQEGVEQLELIDAAALPAPPRILIPRRGSGRVTFEQANAVAVACQQQAAAQPDDTATHHDHLARTCRPHR